MKFIKIIILILLFSCYANGQWIPQYSGVNYGLSDVDFVNPLVGYVSCGTGPGTVLKTTNGGINWIILNTTGFTGLTGISFVNENTGYLVNAGNKILKTTNGGFNWVQQFSPAPGGVPLRGVDFIDSNNGYIVGEGGNVLKTTNGGMNWVKLTAGALYLHHFFCVDFLDVNTGYIAGGNANPPPGSPILKTFDGGSFWLLRWFMPTLATVYGISFCNYNTGYAVASNIAFRTTTGSFEPGQYSYSFLPYPLYDVYTFSSDTAYVVGGGETVGGIYRTVNGGYNWETQYSAGGPSALDFINRNTGYAVGPNGLILKTTNGGVIGVEPISTEVPDNFILYQNYPNPFNAITNFKLRIANYGHVTLKVYDIQGREAAFLLNENMSPGVYKVRFDGTNFPSGVYFVRMDAGGYSKSIKIVLLK